MCVASIRWRTYASMAAYRSGGAPADATGAHISRQSTTSTGRTKALADLYGRSERMGTFLGEVE
ncbi:hypothetical protein GCM10009736_65730 [Actinomadura bangladeshensis]